MALPSTAAIGQPLPPRPMTSIRAAGYTSQPRTAIPGTAAQRGVFDPFNVAGRGPPPPLKERSENSPEDKAREMERKVNELMEEAAILASKGQVESALDKAKEAGKRERVLVKFRQTNNLPDAINADLTYAVLFTLACMYERAGMLAEALATYSLIVRNKQVCASSRIWIRFAIAHISFLFSVHVLSSHYLAACA